MPLGANKAAIMGVAGTAVTGDVVLLATETISEDATISFTSDITSTYGEYIFKFYNIHPASDDKILTFQGSTDGGSNYNVTMTTTSFNAYHMEDDSASALQYSDSSDQQQGTAYQRISDTVGNAADQNIAGELHLFNPASTTFVKHFIAHTSTDHHGEMMSDFRFAGYFNTTSAINAISFKMNSGNMDAGKIKLWGVK